MSIATDIERRVAVSGKQVIERSRDQVERSRYLGKLCLISTSSITGGD